MDQQPESERATVNLSMNLEELENLRNDLMYVALGVSVSIVMLWAISKRLDDLELAVIKVLKGFHS